MCAGPADASGASTVTVIDEPITGRAMRQPGCLRSVSMQVLSSQSLLDVHCWLPNPLQHTHAVPTRILLSSHEHCSTTDAGFGWLQARNRAQVQHKAAGAAQLETDWAPPGGQHVLFCAMVPRWRLSGHQHWQTRPPADVVRSLWNVNAGGFALFSPNVIPATCCVVSHTGHSS